MTPFCRSTCYEQRDLKTSVVLTWVPRCRFRIVVVGKQISNKIRTLRTLDFVFLPTNGTFRRFFRKTTSGQRAALPPPPATNTSPGEMKETQNCSKKIYRTCILTRPHCPQDFFFKIMQSSGNFEQILGSGPLGSKLRWAPLTKILDPPLILHKKQKTDLLEMKKTEIH